MAFDDQDPVDPIEQERLRLRRALETGVVENPDRLAQDRADAARRGMTVQDLRAARERRQPVPPPNWSSLPETSPRTASFVSRPDVAAIAHDDLDNMSAAERIVARIGEGTVRIASDFASAAETTMGGVEPFVRRQLDRIGIPSFDAVRDERTGAIRIVRSTPETYERGLRLADAREAREPIAPGTTWDEVKANPARNVIPFALEEGIVSVPDMAAAVLALPFYVASRAGGISEARAENDQREEATLEDLLAALPPAAASALVERIGTRGIIGLDDAVRGGLRGVPAAAGRAAVREAGTEAIQETVEYAGETVGTETGFDIAQAGERALAGAVAGGPFGGAVRTVTGTAEVVLRRNEADTVAAERGEQAAQTLEELTQLAEASKVRERDPATFREFIDQAAEGTEVENVYVDGAAFAQSLAEAGISLDEVIQAIPSLADQLPDAVATGGDVRISTGEFAAHIAGTDAAGVLMQHLKVNPFDMSRAQAEEFMQTRGEELQAEVEAAAVQAAATEEARAGRERVQQRIAEELDRTGRFTSDVNRAYAALPAAFYDVMAKRLGTTVEAVADTYRLRFSAEMPTSGVASTMDQDQMVDLVHFSRAPGLTRSDPSLWGATRATSPEERARKGRAPDRTYFYDAAIRSRPERAVGMLSPFEYRAQVPASRLYDFDADPLGLKPEGPMTADAAAEFENAVKERGFLGYRFGSVVTGAVALFEPVEMRQAGPIRSPEDARALETRMRELAQEDRAARLAARTDPNEMVFTREPEEFRDAAIAELFPERKTVLNRISEFAQRMLARREPEAPTTVEEVFAPENVGDLLRRDDWAILTAENPRGEQASAEDNAKAQARLEADLRDLGAQFLPAVGRYGQVENSYVVVGITEDQARELGRKYDQDSVLTRKGLIYQDGRITPATGVTAHSSRPDDFFTEVPGTGALFTVDLDFDAEEQTYAQSAPFYSALLRAVENSPTTKAPAAQWKATLAKVPGVKAEEIEWSGINEWLDAVTDPETGSAVSGAGIVDAKGNISREAVADFLREGGVQVEEVVLGGGAEEFDALIDARIDELMEGGESYGRAANLAMDEFNGRAEAQYANYKLPGADDTYRELLIRLPRAGDKDFRSSERHFSGFDDVIAHARFTTRTDAEGNRTLFLEEVQSTHHEAGRDQGYRRIPSAEEREAAERELEQARQNLIAAEQANLPAAERIINARLDFYEAKLAELEAKGVGELSRQDLRDTAAMGPERVDIQEYRRVERQLDLYDDLLNAVDPTSGELRNRAAVRAAFDTPSWGPNVGLPMPTEAERAASGHVAAGLRYQEAQFALDNLEGGGIQDAPWRKTWSALVMKRMIRYAVDNGIDQIAWINGNQQNGGTTGGDGAWFYERNLVNVTNDLVKKYGVRVEPLDMRDADRVRRAEVAARLLAEGDTAYEGAEAEHNRPATALGIQNGIRINDKLREAAAGGFPLFQRDRGQIAFGADISQTPSTISLLRAADLSTFIHETGHFFLEATFHMAGQANAPADIAADVSTILNWFEPGMTLAQWNGMSLEERRPYHEKWARGFEAYHFEGRAPSLALRDLFRRFSAWLKNVYRTLTALDVELTDDVRAVMDRMLASEQEIAEAEQARSFTPLFASRPEGMTEDEWAELQRLGNDATAEAIEQLEQRSARDMRWASGAKDRYVRGLQREAEEQRKAVRAEVTAEVMAEPVNRARNFLRRGLGENGEPVENAAKLDLATLKELYGEDGRWTGLRRGGKYGEVATDGLHPDAVAGMFGYRNGEALIADLLDAENAQDKIKGLTDQRMLERYGDLSDPQSIERAANEAVANDARAKFVAAEMAALDKSVGKRSILNSAAREHAARVVNRLELRRLRPAQYLAAQGRAARAAEKALKKDDLVAAATAKRNQLINLHVARAVQQAQKDVERNSRLFTRIVSAKDDAAARTRNMDLVNAARAILSMYGFGRVKNDPIGYMEALKRYDPTLYADLQPFVEQARANAKPMHELTYEEFVGVRDTVGQLWALSRRVKQVEIDGKLVDLLSITEELGARLENIGIPADRPGMSRAVTDAEKRTFDLLGIRAALRRVESWARGLDQADTGPFRRFIWNPVSEAADRYRAESGVYSKRFRALLDSVRDELKPRDIAAPEIGYTFGGKAELYHALLHTGNGSNKSKLLLGRRWGTRDADGILDDSRWQSFIDRLHTEGVLTERDWNFVQAVWDLLEDTKAGAQRAHRAIYGRYFDEVAADPVDTPFGQYRGGYVPALTDQNLVQDAVLRAEQEAVEGGDSAMFPAASNGFTKSRVEDYTRELALDLRLLPMHLDKVLRFTHLGPPVRDVMRILKNRAFSAKLEAFDPTAQSDLLLPWLQRAAKQIVETPSKGRAGKAADRAFSYIRSAAGMQLMFANVVNTAQQLTGFSGVLLRVKGGNLNRALFRYTRDPKGVADAAHAKSVLLRNRSDSELFEARQAITQLVRLDPSRKDQAVDFLKRHAYFMQSALQNVMDVVSWTAAYDQATERGESEAEAIRFADSVIRETQGSMAPEDVSRFETGSPFVRMFTQFAGYFNMMANLAGTEVQQVARGVGLKRGAGRLFYIYLMTLLIPAVIGDGIAKALRGGWEDEDEDGYLNDLIPWFFASQAKFTLAVVPGVGQAANAALGAFTDVPYDDRMSLSPAISLIEAGVGTPAEVYQSLVEGESFNRTDLRDALNLLGIMTGTPAGVLGRPVGYGLGVAQGDIEPTGPVDVARGLATGNPSPESRTN